MLPVALSGGQHRAITNMNYALIAEQYEIDALLAQEENPDLKLDDLPGQEDELGETEALEIDTD